MAINGNDIIILKDGTSIAGTTAHDIQTSAEDIEVSSPTQGSWRQYIAGRKDWSVTVSYLVLAASGIRDVLTVGTTYTLIIRNRTNSSSMTGQAILTRCQQNYKRGSLVSGSFTFRGTGALS